MQWAKKTPHATVPLNMSGNKTAGRKSGECEFLPPVAEFRDPLQES
jgi:hypothetical protein